MTVEGLEQDGKLHPLQEGVLEEHGLQCGFCTPGMIMTALRVPAEEPEADRGRDPLRRSPATSAAAPATSTSSRPSSTRRPKLQARKRASMALPRPITPEVGGMGHSHQAQGGSALHPRQGHLRRRRASCPGMLYLDIVRSPYAHAKIMKIDTAKALAMPGVLAVITGQDLAKYNLHWMPTLMSDTQMVLPIEKVMYQAQEVAAVLATEPLHRRRRRRRGRGRLRAAAGRRRSAQGAASPAPPCCAPTRRTRRTTTSGTGRRATGPRPTAPSPRPTSTVKQDIYIPRIHVASIETCGCVAHFDKVDGQAHGLDDHAGAARASARCSRWWPGTSAWPSTRSAIISPDIGGGFGGKVPVYPGYVIARRGLVLTGKPVKWIEDRMENLQADSFARDYHITAELAADEGRHAHRRCASRRSPITATPTPPPTRRSSRPGSSTSAPARTT